MCIQVRYENRGRIIICLRRPISGRVCYIVSTKNDYYNFKEDKKKKGYIKHIYNYDVFRNVSLSSL